MASSSLSIIIPAYNESAGIVNFLDEQLLPILKSLSYQTSVIIIDDGSTDDTSNEASKSQLYAQIPTQIIVFTRNFGKEIALSAGLSYCNTDVAIMLDADGQHPVDIIPKMLTKWEQGAKIVTAIHSHNNTKHRLGSKIFYKSMQLMGNHSFKEGTMDYRLLDKTVISEYNHFTEHNRITRGLIDWLGFPQDYIKVSTRKRTSGSPTYSNKKLATLALDSFASMSSTPLVLFGYIGIFITITSFLLGTFILVQQYILGDPLRLDWSGAVAMSVFVSFLVGLVLISQSITALYISHIHTEAKNRPLFIIDKTKSKNLTKEER